MTISFEKTIDFFLGIMYNVYSCDFDGKNDRTKLRTGGIVI